MQIRQEMGTVWGYKYMIKTMDFTRGFGRNVAKKLTKLYFLQI